MYVRSKAPLKAGDFAQVMITDAYEYDLAGVVRMNLPNILTISRIVLAVVLVFLLEESSSTGNILAVIVFAIASLTDFYDGHLAKKRGLVSNFGKIMDPIADKILLLSAFGVLAHIGMIAWWMFIVIAIREILVTASRLCGHASGPSAGRRARR